MKRRDLVRQLRDGATDAVSGATGVGWCRDLPVELDRQVRHGSGEALIRREQRALQIARGAQHRDATNVPASEPSQPFIDLVCFELTSTVKSRQSREDLGIQLRDGDERRLGVVGQPSTDALPGGHCERAGR